MIVVAILIYDFHWNKIFVFQRNSESNPNILAFENGQPIFIILDMSSTTVASDNQLGLLTDWMNPRDLICKLEVGDLVEINRRLYHVSCNFFEVCIECDSNILQHWAVCIVCESGKSTLVHVSTTETGNRYS